MNLEKNEQVLLLGALLHDIGKFAQRALDEGERELHQELSEKVVKALTDLLTFLDKEDKERVRVIVREHHEGEPSEFIARIVKKADRISASERQERRFFSDEKISEFRLRSSLSALGKESCSQDIHSLPMLPLAPLGTYADNIFPIKPSEDKGSYEEIWKGFADEAKNLPKDSFDAFFLSLYHLLYKYTWCVPSAVFKSYPTISLFDHARMTAAIAWCLYHTGNAESDNDKRFMLISGDLGGIQDFIYYLASPDDAQTGMAKRLRGRSLYLSLLTESIARFIMGRLRLPEPNLIFAGGGGFLLLAPNTSGINENLKEAIKETEAWLLERHLGQLSLAVVKVEASINDMGSNFGKLMKDIHEELAKAKERKFSEMEAWPELASDEDECIVCAAPMKESEGKLVEEDGTERLVSICPDCQLHESIGGLLPDSKYLLWTEEDWNSDGPFFEILGQKWCLLKEAPDSPPETGILYKIRGMNFLEPIGENRNLAMGFRFIASHVPDTFESMAKKAEGASYLAALRMDVDGMGYLLAKGIPMDFRTPSVYASISRQLDLFFSGYINTLVRENDNLYIVYAGGDDLFIVGAWNEVIEKAREINKEFWEYTENSESLHLSAGYTIFKPKFPIGRAAEECGEAENKAKKGGKNALCAFNEVFGWKDVKKALCFAEMLEHYIGNSQISKGFVQTMLDIYHKDHKEGRLIWASRVLYQIARNVPDELKGELQEKLVKIPVNEKTMEDTMMKTAQLWANVALLKVRKKEETKETKEEKR
ncbi:MAG: type III-A CRISPR-associated protein Cas10/Csm1 [candidate division WOR-3 bacterium]